MKRRCPRRRRSDDASEGSDLGSIHTSVDDGEEAVDEETYSANVLDQVRRSRRRRRCARGERRGRLGHVPDALGLPGVHRAAGLDRVARARGHARRLDEHTGLARHAEGARRGVRPSARADPRDRGAPRRRVRRQVRARRAAGRRSDARASPARPARPHPRRGLPGDEPGLGAGHGGHDRRAQGRNADRDLRTDDRRPRLERRLGRGGEHVGAPRRSLPLAAHDIRGYGVQTNRFTFGAYRAPGAPTAAFAVESLARRARGRSSVSTHSS